MQGCLDDNEIVALLETEVPIDERARWTAHLDACAPCRGLVADAARNGADAGPRVLAPGAIVGRYVVLEAIGAGGMGVVYAAYDPQLGRKVALKLLRPEPLAAPSPVAGRERLLREAQALAKLSHPNVVAIHDVGTIDQEVFLTMEFVEGGTLGDWLAQPRQWRAVLDMMRQVGEGLAAAHAAGLVHRDLKPENVLVGEGNRARVTDFGLARAAMGEEAPEPSGGSPSKDAPHLTATGALLGTPAYMAPEQLSGKVADARSDQFSFAVTFYEALYGVRPFAGDDVVTIRSAITRGAFRPPLTPRPVPSWLHRIVARALLADPDARFGSIADLLAATAAGVPLSTRRAALVAGALGVVGVIALGTIAALRRSEPVCSGAEAAWGGTWSHAQQAVVEAAFSRSGSPTAASAAATVGRMLDDNGARWRAMHQGTCEATRVRGDQSEALMDARLLCLEERRSEIAALVGLLAKADRELVDRAVSAALALPSLADCANLSALPREAPLPAARDMRARIEHLEERRAEASALEYAGRYAEGAEVARTSLAEARAIGFTPLTARLLLAAGRLASGEHDVALAEGSLHQAATIAQEAGADLVAADAWTALIRVVGFHRSRPDDGRLWASYAEAAIHRAGGDDEREATRLRALATVAWRRQGKFAEARELILRARDLYERTHGPHYEFELASCDEGIAGIDFDLGYPADALARHRSVTAVRERLFGKDHPSLAASYVNQGEDLTALGRPEEAVPLLLRSIELARSTAPHGGDAYYRHRLAAALRGEGDGAGALAADRQALAALELAGDAGGYWESWALTGLGEDLLLLGRPGEALEPLERASAERATDAIAYEVAETGLDLSLALAATGDRERARQVAQAARDRLQLAGEPPGSSHAALQRRLEQLLETTFVDAGAR